MATNRRWIIEEIVLEEDENSPLTESAIEQVLRIGVNSMGGHPPRDLD